MAIRDVLVPALHAAFPNSGLWVPDLSEPVAVFPAACPEVGAVSIHSEFEEITVEIERVTHHHVTAPDDSLGSEEQAHAITEEVVWFLRELFADRVLLWSENGGRGGGGWRYPFGGEIPADLREGVDLFVWSGRLNVAG
ncbi:MAG: hypothetical protein AB2L07_21935 [Thermoanaerobaculaceae bacterium]